MRKRLCQNCHMCDVIPVNISICYIVARYCSVCMLCSIRFAYDIQTFYSVVVLIILTVFGTLEYACVSSFSCRFLLRY